LIMNNVRTKEQFNTVCEIKDGPVFVDGKPRGTWETIDRYRQTIRASDHRRGTVSLRRANARDLVGQETPDTGVVRWWLERVHVVARGIHQAGNSPPQEIVFWSTGRIVKPDGRAKWTHHLKTNELVLEWPEFTDRCVMSSDGHRYEGRNQHGTLINGRRGLNR